jgi:hypothetical protein
MRIPIKALCEQKRVKSDGTSWIFFQYFHDGVRRVFLNTQLSIPPAHWDRQRECIKSSLPSEYGDHIQLNQDVNHQLRHASDPILLAKDQKIADLGTYIKESFSPTLNLDAPALEGFQLKTAYIPRKRKKEPFFEQLDDYINSKRKKVKPATITVFNSMICIPGMVTCQ